jgi:hypothetical protein
MAGFSYDSTLGVHLQKVQLGGLSHKNSLDDCFTSSITLSPVASSSPGLVAGVEPSGAPTKEKFLTDGTAPLTSEQHTTWVRPARPRILSQSGPISTRLAEQLVGPSRTEIRHVGLSQRIVEWCPTVVNHLGRVLESHSEPAWRSR